MQVTGRESQSFEAKLNVKIMHEMFCTLCFNIKLNYYFYLKFLCDNCNLHFGQSQVDTCNKCKEFNLKLKSTFLDAV